MKKLSKSGFSLIELSVVILVIGILVIGITKGARIMREAKLKSAQSLTNSSPVNSINGLVFWLDATDSASLKTSSVANIATTPYGNLEDSSLVSAWQDRNTQSSNKITLTAPNDSNRPTYIVSGIHDLPSLQFSGNSVTQLTSSIAPLSAGDDNYTLIGVFQPAVQVSAYVFAQSLATPTNNKQASLYMSGALMGFSGASNDYVPFTYTTNKDYILVNRIDDSQAGNIKIYINGTQYSGATTTPGSLDLGNEIVVVGARTSSGRPYTGLISEIIIYNKALTQNEINSINSYLSTKYNIK